MGGRNKNLPDDKVLRCRVTLNQQLMSEQSKPHTQSSNSSRALVPTWTFKKVQETKDWHVDKRNTRRLTDLLLRKKDWEFNENMRKKERQKSCLMRLPTNLTAAHRISEVQIRHSTFLNLFLNTFLFLSYRASYTTCSQAYAQYLMTWWKKWLWERNSIKLW